MASAAILSKALEDSQLESHVDWSGVNFDNKLDWDNFAAGLEFAVVDFHFHPRAKYWFDHHPTTFLREIHREEYQESEFASFDPESPSCPPIIIRHARQYWNWEAPEHFIQLSKWSDVIDSAGFENAEQALFGTESALQVARSLTCAPNYGYNDQLVEMMRDQPLEEIAAHPLVSKCCRRAERNRDNALENFSANIVDQTPKALLADLRSKKIRRERFAPFYLHPDVEYAVTVIPTRAGVHITAASNPWNRPSSDVHIGHLLEKYDGGGHRGVGGCNPPSEEIAMAWAHEIFELLAGLNPEDS